MMIAPAHPETSSQDLAATDPWAGSLRMIWRRDGQAILVLALLTVCWLILFFTAGRGGELHSATVGTLGVLTLWCAMIAPAAAVSGRGAFSALLRAGTLADASGLVLLVIWLAGRGVDGGLSLFSVLSMYLILASMVLASAAVICCGRSPAGRSTLAVLVAVGWCVALSSPLLANGVITAQPDSADPFWATWAVRVNPFYAMTSAADGELRFVWHYAPAIYDWVRLGEYALPAPVPWWQTAGLYGAVAAVGAALATIRWVRRPLNDPPAGP